MGRHPLGGPGAGDAHSSIARFGGLSRTGAARMPAPAGPPYAPEPDAARPPPPLCPAQFSTDRQAAPQLVVPTAPLAREAFFDSRRSYDLNKIRSHTSISFA